jgi:tRNA(Ile2) C34 agmatinyltransferase TiaS
MEPEVRVKTPVELEMEKAGLKSMAPIMSNLTKLIGHMSNCPKCNGIMQPVKFKCNKCAYETGGDNGNTESEE